MVRMDVESRRLRVEEIGVNSTLTQSRPPTEGVSTVPTLEGSPVVTQKCILKNCLLLQVNVETHRCHGFENEVANMEHSLMRSEANNWTRTGAHIQHHREMTAGGRFLR